MLNLEKEMEQVFQKKVVEKSARIDSARLELETKLNRDRDQSHKTFICCHLVPESA